jgi:UDP:flavonoid glycosyltransferase YjiC (YdhE family)
MASVLFVTWDGGGNVPPALGIAAELRARGEQVRFLGHEQQRAAIEGAGFRFEPYRHARSWSSAAPADGPRALFTVFSVFTDRGPGTDLLASVEREPADVVVIDCLLLGALAAADRAGLRRVVLAHTFYDYLASSWSRGPVRFFGLLKGQHPVRLWTAADLMLVTAAPELDPSVLAASAGRSALPANACHTGPVVRAPSPPPPPPADGTPRILVSLSTIYFPGQARVLQAVLDALADLPVTGVVTTGPAVDPGQLSAPGNCELHRYVPHDEVLPGVSMVIGHGGHATTMRALAWGRPLLIIPMHPMLDQPMIGKAVSEAGAAVILPKTAPPARIREAAARLLADGPHRAAARRLGDSIRAADGAATAATRLQELLSPAYQR